MLYVTVLSLRLGRIFDMFLVSESSIVWECQGKGESSSNQLL